MAETATAPDPTEQDEPRQLLRSPLMLFGVKPGDHRLRQRMGDADGLVVSLHLGAEGDRHREPVIVEFDSPADAIGWLESALAEVRAKTSPHRPAKAAQS